MEISTDRIAAICTKVLQCDRNLASSIINRRCVAEFGLKRKVCVYLWDYLEGLLAIEDTPKHIFWALSLLKLYEFEEARSSRLQVDEKLVGNRLKFECLLLANLICYVQI